MGIAICGMHYMAMYAGICVSPQPVGDAIASTRPGAAVLVICGVGVLLWSASLLAFFS